MRRADFLSLAVAAVMAPLSLPSFDQAVGAIEATIGADRSDPLVAPTALPRLYHHGHATDDAVVLYHGFTNCPQQFDDLARRFHARGCNVYVPRIPLHGYRDRLTRALENLSVAQLAEAATESYRLTRGLGRRVSAVGLSLGGSMALYLAQTQPIDRAVPIAPFLIPIGLPDWLGLAAMTTIGWLPDWYVWWDPRLKAECRPLYAYPGFPTHALATCVFFGNVMVRASKTNARPAARHCTLVTNRTESAVNNAVNRALIDRWNASGAHYDEVVLGDLGSPRHDIIDPTTFPQAATMVYPKLESIVLDAAY